MTPRRPGLWVEIALTLALITLATILLNAGIFWLLLQRGEEERRTDLAVSLSSALTTQLEIEALREDREGGYRRVLAAYQGAGLEVIDMWVVDAGMNTVASVSGTGPTTPDAGLQAALFGKSQHVTIIGSALAPRVVQVTSPVAPRGAPVAALRVSMAMRPTGVPGGPVGFVLAYTGFSGLAIALFGFSLFRRRLLAPVEALQAGTNRIAAGDFGHQLEVDAARELQELSLALNTMSASLQAYRKRTAVQVERLERANEELESAQEALVRSEKLASVGRLAAGLAHEVGNPLAAVLGYVELLDQGLDDPELEADLLARARIELERINAIIRQLLDFARTGTGVAEDVPLHEAVQEAVDTFGMLPDARGAELKVTLSGGLASVRFERDKLHQVLVNLMVNGLHAAASADAPVLQVRARMEPADEGAERHVEVSILDNGPGFSAVALERAFEPFFTTKDVGQGTGLGLATCLQVVESAGGHISLGNRAEGGAWVRIRLPAV